MEPGPGRPQTKTQTEVACPGCLRLMSVSIEGRWEPRTRKAFATARCYRCKVSYRWTRPEHFPPPWARTAAIDNPALVTREEAAPAAHTPRPDRVPGPTDQELPPIPEPDTVGDEQEETNPELEPVQVGARWEDVLADPQPSPESPARVMEVA